MAMLERLDAVRAIFNNLEVIVWAVDTEGTIVISEGGGLKYLGLPPGAIVGQSFYELYGQSSDGVNNLQRSLAGETLIVQHNDHGRALESRFVPVRDESEEAVVGVVGVTQDITERLRSQAELREQAELLDLAHDAIVVRRLEAGDIEAPCTLRHSGDVLSKALRIAVVCCIGTGNGSIAHSELSPGGELPSGSGYVMIWVPSWIDA